MQFIKEFSMQSVLGSKIISLVKPLESQPSKFGSRTVESVNTQGCQASFSLSLSLSFFVFHLWRINLGVFVGSYHQFRNISFDICTDSTGKYLLPVFENIAYLITLTFEVSVNLRESHFGSFRWQIACDDQDPGNCWFSKLVIYRPFWIGRLSGKCLPIRTLLYISLKHILVVLTVFMGIPNSLRILYNTYLLAES